MEHIARPAGFVTRAQLALLGDPRKPAAQFGQVVREPLDALRTARVRWQDRNRD